MDESRTGSRGERPPERLPSGGLVIIVLVPIILLVVGGFLTWVVWTFPGTGYAEYLPWAVGGISFLTALTILGMFVSVLPPYFAFAKDARRKIARALAQASEAELALRGSGAGYWDYRVPQNEIFFSGHLMAMLGYGDRDLSEKMAFWLESIHPDDLEGVKRTMDYHLKKRTPEYAVEYRIKKQNGEYIWVEDRGRAMFDGNAPLRCAGIMRDISNEKRVQEVLQSRTTELEEARVKIEAEIQNVKKFQKAVDSSTEAVAITKPDATIIYVNEAWEKLNGHSADEALGRNPKLLKNDKTKPEIFQEMWEKITAGYTFRTEDLFNRRKDGSEYQAEFSIFPISDNGQIIFYVSVCQDITQRKEIDRAKTEFVSLASHQLRTPLSAIRWYSEMLLSKYVGELNEKQKQYVKEIYAGNLRMVDLVNALLNVSRIDLGTFAIEPEPVDPMEISDSVLMELTPQITEKQQTVTRIYDPSVGTYSADPKLLRIIFQNFLSNSVKYTQAGGHVEVEVSKRDPDLYIRVSDNGYGIPISQHDKIFEKLFRADNVRQKDTEGTGLGMYIVKAIVEASGGRIWFESEENNGTTFHVLLPLAGMPKKTGSKGLS
ncbi:MAG TPA: PAS domain S-box protein [Candidatus Paceibacterota bacterium]|nr:PAS domain S-box protein [Candidatus Paceibacterota bacterium]